MKTKILSVLVLLLVVISSCKKDEGEPAEMIVGKWTVSSTEILGTNVPGDGSYLIFNACSGGTCTGVDYMASDTTTGSFTYVLNGEGTVLAITDTMDEGGNYNFSFDVLELSDNDMRLSAETGIFGTMKMVLTKN